MSDIDKIFSKKLTNWEKTPSDRAWEKINSNLSQKRKTGIFWYYIAASICLVIISTLIIILKDGEKIASIELPNVNKKPAIVVSPTVKIASIDNIVEPNTSIKEETPSKKLVIENTQTATHKPVKQDGIFDESLVVSASEIEKINSEEVVFSPEKEEVVDENKSYLINTVQPIEIIIKKGNAIAGNSKQDSVEKPRSKWGRAYEQVVNLKNGEKVNLQEFSNLLAFHKKDKETQNK